MEARIVRAGIGSAVVALLVGAAFGSYGGWAPVLSLGSSALGTWIIAAVLSIFVAYIYANWFDGFLPGSALVRGVIYGALVWVLLLILGGVSGFFKSAVYPTSAGGPLFLSLVLHLVWGGVLGLLYDLKP